MILFFKFLLMMTFPSKFAEFSTQAEVTQKSSSEFSPTELYSINLLLGSLFWIIPPILDHSRCFSIKSCRVSIVSCWLHYLSILRKPQPSSLECCSLSILWASPSCCFIIQDASPLSLVDPWWYCVDVSYLSFLKKPKSSFVECCLLSILEVSPSCCLIIWNPALLSPIEFQFFVYFLE